MPDNSANRATIRASRHSIRVYASFIVPAAIAAGTVLSTPTYPATNHGNTVNLTYVTGTFTLVDYGMEIAFFDTATGAFKGRTHIRYGGTISANTVPVREYAQATLNLVAGDTFRIYPEWRLHDKLVAATTAFPPDFRFMTTENSEPEPVVNSGGDWAGFVDGYGTASELSYATVTMTGSTSFTVYPTAGTVNHLWTLPTGVTFAPGSVSTDANPVLRATVGSYTITHQGTDAASGSARLSHPSIRVHNASDMPHRVNVTSYEGAADSGWNWEVEILSGSVSLSAIPDGCKCILWTQERYAGVEQSFRNASPGRGRILGVGYVARDTSSGSGEDGVHHLSFEVISPLERLKQIKSYSKVMIEDAFPDEWGEILGLDVLRGFLQVLQYYTTWGESGKDTILDPAILNPRYPAHFLDAAPFYEQLAELPKTVDARMICDRTGRLDVHVSPAFIPLPDRAAVTVALELEDEDILEYEFTREHATNVAQMKVSGISGGTENNAPVFSLYPGAAAGEGAAAPEIAKLILDDTAPQADINGRTGRYGSLEDMTFQINPGGIKHKAFDLRLKLRGAYDVFDFYKEFIEVTVTGNKRGLDLSGLRFYLLSSSTDFDPEYGFTTTNLVLRMETNAADGETFIPDEEAVPPYTPPGDIPVPYTPPLATPWLPAYLNRIAGINTDGYWYYTVNLLDTLGAIWARTLIPDLTGNLTDSVQSAFVLTRQIVVTDAADGIYTVENASGDGASMATTLRKTLRGTAVLRIIDASFGANYIVVKSYYAVDGTWHCYSLDGGLTWSAEVQVSAQLGISPPSGLFVSSRAPGTATLNGFSAPDSGELYSASANFSAVSASGITPAPVAFPGAITKAWADNENTLFYSAVGGASPVIYRKIGAAATVDVTPVITGTPAYAPNNRSIHVAPTDANTVVAAVISGTGFNWVITSRDQLTTFDTVFGIAGLVYDGAEVAGDSADYGLLWGPDGAIATLDIVTGALTDRSGNIPTDFPTVGRFVRMRGQ